MEIYPSIISSDLLNLEKVINLLNPHVDGYHIDVMDNHFVPNLTWGASFVNAFSSKIELPLCVHLMVDDPQSWVSKFSLKQKDFFVFHYESLKNDNIGALIKDIKKKKIKVGIALNPGTPISSIHEYLQDIDQVIIMSVNPGFSGQAFIKESKDKLLELVKYKNKNNLSFIICMDGGINKDNIADLSNNGLERAAIASAIFSEDDLVLAVKTLKELSS